MGQAAYVHGFCDSKVLIFLVQVKHNFIGSFLLGIVFLPAAKPTGLVEADFLS